MASTSIIPQQFKSRKHHSGAVAERSLPLLALWLFVIAGPLVLAEDLPVASEPILRVETNGPLSLTTSLLFDPSDQLYEAGFDKSVQCWRLDAGGRSFQREIRGTIRWPIGPGLQGSINAMAISPDGEWLAVAGRGRMRGTSSFKDRGLVIPSGSITKEMRLDEGSIYVFQRRTGESKVFQGHDGPVLALSFVQSGQEKESRLLSLGVDTNQDASEATPTRTAIVWDADGRELSRLNGIGGSDQIRPTILGWQAEQTILVAIATGEDALTVWNSSEAKPTRVPAGRICTSVVLSPDRRTLCVGSFGEMRLYKTDQIRDGKPILTTSLPNSLPVALCPIGEPPGAWRVAVLLLERPGADDSRLAMQVLNGSNPRETQAKIDLWAVSAGADFPTLAASRDGHWIAVGGHPGQDLLVVDATKPQLAAQHIRSEAKLFQQSRLARRGAAWGIHLTSVDGAVQLLDLASGRFVEPANWQSDVSRTDRWTLQTPIRGTIGAITARPRDGVAVSLNSPDGHRFSAAAFHAYGKNEEEPIVARATMFRGEPIVEIVSLRLNRVIRKLTGHTSEVSSLSFNEDGRFLISTAADRTVRVFPMADLIEKHLGKRGGLSDITVTERNGDLVALEVGPTPIPNATLQVGDVILGIDRLGEIEKIDSVESLVNRLAGFLPGTPVLLHIRRNQEHLQQSVVLSQAVDELNPLFSLLVVQDAVAGGDSTWIGWSSLGPYETSDRVSEQLLGWHFNETNGGSLRARFAPIREYRQTYFRTGLLTKLLESGAATVDSLRPNDPPIARPNIWVGIQTPGGGRQAFLDSRTPTQVFKPQVQLLISLLGAGSERIQRVEWTMDKSKGGLLPTGELEWATQIDLFEPGTHPLEISLITDETPAQIFTETVAIRYEPPPPTIQVDPIPSDVVRDKSLPVVFRVKRLMGSWNTIVRVGHRHGDKEALVHEDRLAREEKQWRQTVALEPGTNIITITASHQFEDSEIPSKSPITMETLMVTYNPKDSSPPEIVAELLDANEQIVAAKEDGSPIQFTSPRAVLRGTIRAKEDLASVIAGLGDNLKPIEGFQPATRKEASFQHLVQLHPGVQTLLIAAKTDLSVEQRREWLVEYIPEVPEVVLLEPKDGTLLQDALDINSIPLKATLAAAINPEAFIVSVLVNGESVESVEWNKVAGSVQAILPLRPGDNRVEVATSNAWGRQRITSATVTRRCPPRIVEQTFEPSPMLPRGDVRLIVDAPPERPPTILKLGELERKGDILPSEDNPNRWRIRLSNVSLHQGENHLIVNVGNADGFSREPARFTVDYAPPPPKKPVVEFVEPSSDVFATKPALEIAFRVESESPLEFVKLFVSGKETWAGQSTDAPDPNINRVTVPLTPGVNVVSIVAANAGGEAENRLRVNYVAPPAHIVATEVELSDSTEILEPNEKGRFHSKSALPEGAVVLKGRVQVFRKLQRELTVTAWVNGFRQPSVTLLPPSGEESPEGRPFSIPIFLDRGENLVQLTLPDQAEDESSDLEIELSCEAPVRDRELYAVALSPDLAVEDMSLPARTAHEESLRERVLKIVGGAEDPNGLRSQTNVFSSVEAFIGTGRVDDSQVNAILSVLSRRLRSDDNLRPAQRAVIILCEGQVVKRSSDEGREDRYVIVPSHLTPEEVASLDLDLYGFSPDRLLAAIRRLPGAHILCFEVRRTLDESIWTDASMDLDDTNTAMLKTIAPKANQPLLSLFDLMKEGIARNQTLSQVDAYIMQSVQTSKAPASPLVYESNIPRPLEQMVLGPAQ